MISLPDLIVMLVVGLIAGWLAARIMKGRGYGLVGDLIIGMIGAVIGGWLWTRLGLPIIVHVWVNAVISATVGAVILLFVLRLIKR